MWNVQRLTFEHEWFPFLIFWSSNPCSSSGLLNGISPPWTPKMKPQWYQRVCTKTVWSEPIATGPEYPSPASIAASQSKFPWDIPSTISVLLFDQSICCHRNVFPTKFFVTSLSTLLLIAPRVVRQSLRWSSFCIPRRDFPLSSRLARIAQPMIMPLNVSWFSRITLLAIIARCSRNSLKSPPVKDSRDFERVLSSEDFFTIVAYWSLVNR